MCSSLAESVDVAMPSILIDDVLSAVSDDRWAVCELGPVLALLQTALAAGGHP